MADFTSNQSMLAELRANRLWQAGMVLVVCLVGSPLVAFGILTAITSANLPVSLNNVLVVGATFLLMNALLAVLSLVTLRQYGVTVSSSVRRRFLITVLLITLGLAALSQVTVLAYVLVTTLTCAFAWYWSA